MDILEIFFLFFLFYSTSCAETITRLPGQPANVAFKQYSGYIVTDAKHGRALFYYFVEAESSAPLSRPLTLWLNGVPGCSSLGFGAFMETGPFLPGENGVLLRNKYSWSLESNMLYVESPIGVGFSYSNTSSDYIGLNDTTAALENFRFLLNWFEEFPQHRDTELFISGESYAGHYIPQLAAVIVENKKYPNIRKIKLKGIALGNPLLDADISMQAGDFLWAHGSLSDETYMLQKTVCNYSRRLRETIQGQLSQECRDVFNQVYGEVGGSGGIEEKIYTGDILLPKCTSQSSSQQFMPTLELDNEIGRVPVYFNNPKVQKALHANTTALPYTWELCGGRPLRYKITEMLTSIIPLVSDLIKNRIPIVLYSGDQDSKIPLTQTRIITENIAKDLKLVPVTKHGLWYDNRQVGGWRLVTIIWQNKTWEECNKYISDICNSKRSRS